MIASLVIFGILLINALALCTSAESGTARVDLGYEIHEGWLNVGSFIPPFFRRRLG